MSDLTIYVIVGRTGEYSDRTEWLVQAYHTEVAAQAEVIRLETYVREHLPPDCDTPEIDYDDDKLQAAEHAYKTALGDLGFKHDYTGTHYHYEAVPLVEEQS